MDWMWNDDEQVPTLDIEMVAMELVELCDDIGDDELAMEQMMAAVIMAMTWRAMERMMN